MADETLLLTRTGARRLLGCDWAVAKRLADEGFVRLRRVKGLWVAPESEWIDGYAKYMDAHASAKRTQARDRKNSNGRLTAPVVMSAAVYSGLYWQYGAVRCYVCGKHLAVGQQWRWFVPAADQMAGIDNVIPAFGCAHGHEGRVIEVQGRAYRIESAGERPTLIEQPKAQAV